MALAASFVATHIYYASLRKAEDAVMDESVAWTIVGALSGLGVSFFAFFLPTHSGPSHELRVIHRDGTPIALRHNAMTVDVLMRINAM